MNPSLLPDDAVPRLATLPVGVYSAPLVGQGSAGLNHPRIVIREEEGIKNWRVFNSLIPDLELCFSILICPFKSNFVIK